MAIELISLISTMSLSDWGADVGRELVQMFRGMSVTQWSIVSGVTIFLGFLCMRGNPVS